MVLVGHRVSITWEACNRSKPNERLAKKEESLQGVKACISKEKEYCSFSRLASAWCQKQHASVRTLVVSVVFISVHPLNVCVCKKKGETPGFHLLS